jgi:glycosyltransferase involved in cell wall biosynthesis
VSISVLVPSFNSAPYLGAALRSALDQDPGPDEIIVQDGGSTDGTADLIAAIGDDRIKFISEPDGGQSDALNKAIARASGEWVVWLNADDLVSPGLFGSTDPEADFVYGDFDFIDGEGRVLRHVTPHAELSVHKLLVDGCYLFSGAALFRRSIFERFGGIAQDLRYTMDYELYLRIAPHVRSRYVPRTLGQFRVHGDSKTSGITWGLFVETGRVRRHYGGYGKATRVPVLTNQVKQVIDVATLPVRSRLRG